MPLRSLETPLSPLNPTRVFVLVLLAVFFVECAIMVWLLPQLPEVFRGQFQSSLIDSAALTIVVAPVIWFLAVLPLRRLFDARGRLLQKLFDTQETERAHIARDLHDSIGQQLTAIMVHLRSLEEVAGADAIRSRLGECRAICFQAHGEVRALARGLRPTILEDIGLTSALERLCIDFQQTHDLKVNLIINSEIKNVRLSGSAETALYRIVQEALSNIVRHSGATDATVELTIDSHTVKLNIRDTGKGFDLDDSQKAIRSEPGFGLRSIRERSALLNGSCHIKSQPGMGTTIQIEIPMD